MSLSQKAIDEFKELYKKQYGEELSDFVASDAANRLVNFMRIIYRPVPHKDEEEFKKLEQDTLDKQVKMDESEKIDFVANLVNIAKHDEIHAELLKTLGKKKANDYMSTMGFAEHGVNDILKFLIQDMPIKELSETEAIFVFGHVDPRVAKHAAELWKLNKAPKVILTGKGRRDIPEGFQTESDYYASILKTEGVPETAIILEKESTNTLENVLFGMKAAQAAGLSPESLILCAMPPLLRRSIATFKKQFPDVQVSGSGFKLNRGSLSKKQIERLLGEFDRFKKYADKGDMVAVEIPEDITRAIKRVKDFLDDIF